MENRLTPEAYSREAGEAHWLGQVEKQNKMLLGKGVPGNIADLLCSPQFDSGNAFSKAVAGWMAGKQRFLTLIGPSYRGKTTGAASAFLNHTFEYSWFVVGQPPVTNRSWAYGRFVPCATFQGWSKAGFGDQRSKDLLTEARQTHLLVFDDLGTELSDFKALFTDLVSYRTAGMTPDSKMYPSAPMRTIITTNLSEGQIAEAYGDRVLNRLRAEGQILNALVGR
jgi:DNA replication protein DnaC